MTKEEALLEFIKGLRIAINSASAYFKEHPGFIKSIETFKNKVDTLLGFLNPVKIYFSADSLFIDGEYFKKLPMYAELAATFHLRKIKSVEIHPGVATGELIEVFSVLASPRREFLRQGGVKKLLGNKLTHIIIDELDYSQFLKEDRDIIDAWIYAVNNAVKIKDTAQLSKCADDFKEVIIRIELKELLHDIELKQAIFDLSAYLRESEKEKFKSFALELFNSIIGYKHAIDNSQLNQLSAFFQHFSEDDFAAILWQELSTNNNFDMLSLNLFSQLAGEGRQKGITVSLLDKIKGKNELQSNPEAIKRIDTLLKKSTNTDVPEIYTHTLLSLLGNISFDRKLFFDRVSLEQNYHSILLNLIQAEENDKRLPIILEKAQEQAHKAAEEKKYHFLVALLEVSEKQKKLKPQMAPLFDGLAKEIFLSAEGLIWEEGSSAEIKYLINKFSSLTRDSEFYLEKIFEEEKITPYALELFFKFFPGERKIFEQKIKERHNHTEFLIKVVKSVREIDSSLALDVLKGLFLISGEYIKIEILQAMQQLSRVDPGFLFSILKTPDIPLKKEALIIVAKEKDIQQGALKILFDIPNFLGFKNKFIMDNLIAVEQADFKTAAVSLKALVNKKYIWNIGIRTKAKQILRSWNVE